MSVAEQTLSGRTIVITRAGRQAGGLSDRLERLGARVLSVPTIAFADPTDWGPADGAIRDLAGYDWILFTSVNGVERFFDRMEALGAGGRLPPGARVAAIGPATAAALTDRGAAPEVVPDVYRAEELASALPLPELAGRRVLIARAEKAREILPETLSRAGAEVLVAACYRTVRPEVDVEDLARRLSAGEVDAVTFTSSSTVDNFVDLFRPGEAARLLSGTSVVCIGPITAATARRHGIDPAGVAGQYTIEGLVETVTRLLAQG